MNASDTRRWRLQKGVLAGHSIGDEDIALFSEHRTPGGAARNAVTEAPHSASFKIILQPKQAEVFRTPVECHSITRDMLLKMFVLLIIADIFYRR